MKKDKKGCSYCRYQQTGWDGGFFGEPMTCECYHFGNTENRENCPKFKRPFPKGFDLLTAFMGWFNRQGEGNIDYADLLKFRKEWK